MSFFRYPGGKKKIKDVILPHILKHNLEYREPFFGAGSIGLEVLKKNNTVWFNDADPGIACLWECVAFYPEEFIAKIEKYTPSVIDFYSFKKELEGARFPWEKAEVIDLAFKKLVIHQTSFSGLGTKSGGPLGGKDQSSQYKIDCRWSPKYLAKKIKSLHELFKNKKVNISCCDFSILLNPGDFVTYLDPPYYNKGGDLYQFSFSHDSHVRLCNYLKDVNTPWVLSYDDCEEIRDLYSWANIQEIHINYTIKTARKKSELLILP